MEQKHYTVIVVPEDSSEIKRWTLSSKSLRRWVISGWVALGLVVCGLVHYGFVAYQAAENVRLTAENAALSLRLAALNADVERVEQKLTQLGEFSTRLQALTQVNDPARSLAIGPVAGEAVREGDVLYASGEKVGSEYESMDSPLTANLVDAKLVHVEEDLRERDENLRDLHSFFTRDTLRLSSTPSIAPTRTRLVTSSFGVRVDPLTEQEVMHKGIDFAGELGDDVVSTGDGKVVFVGERGGYGKSIVVDHGFGYQSHYAHLNSYTVTLGDDVTRGQIIGAVGNSGRTTGPHLHYEVRYLGLPQSPDRFILNR